MDRALVVGSTGLVGMNLVEELHGRGKQVTAHIHRRQPCERWEGVEYRDENLESRGSCRELVRGHDAVFLCASAKYSAGLARIRPMERAFSTLGMTMNVLQACLEEKVGKVVMLSSSCVYTGGSGPATEEDNIYGEEAPAGRFYYVWLKRMAEKCAEMAYRAQEKQGMDVIVFRPTNIYGPYDDFDLQSSYVMPALIRKVADGLLPLTLWGDGETSRNFIYVGDLVAAMLEAAESVSGFEVFNIGADRACTLKELSEMVLRVSGEPCTQLRLDPTKPSSDTVIDISFDKVKERLGYRPGTALPEGIAKTRNWYLEHKELFE